MPGEESKFANDKKEIEQEARKLEKERDINRSKDPYFEYAEVLLQIAIVMASVSIIAASRAVFGFSVAGGVTWRPHVRKRISADLCAALSALSVFRAMPKIGLLSSFL